MGRKDILDFAGWILWPEVPQKKSCLQEFDQICASEALANRSRSKVKVKSLDQKSIQVSAGVKILLWDCIIE